MGYVFRRTKKMESNGKLLTTESVLKRFTAVYNNVRKYKSYPATTCIEVLDDAGDLIYLYDPNEGIEEIYKANGELTSNILEMGKW